MNWKGLKGLVLLLSITLASPSSSVHAAAAQRSSQKQRTDSSQKFSSKGHSSLTAFPSFESYESGTKRDHQTADSKETPLIRLKRIKRQTESSSSSSSAQRSASSNWPGRTPINGEPEVLKIHDKSSSSLIGARPTNAVSSDRRKFPASHSGAYRDSTTGSRVHTKMLRKKETANRNGNRGGGGKGHGPGKVPTRKSNEISDPVQTAAAAAIGHHHKAMSGTGGGGYFHHRNEQSRLESAAEFALRQRTPHKKTKRLKNRSDLDLLKVGGRTGHAPPQPLSRPRPAEEAGAFGGGQQASRYHDAMVKARGGGRGHAVPVKAGHGDDHGGGGGETSHRSRRGQRSGATAVNGGGGHGQGQKVRAELEHIKRMQRDLMKEISHLEHMKKKKKVQRRSASSSSSHSSSSSIIHQQNHRQQIAKAHRK